MSEAMQNVVELLGQIESDSSVPKNIRIKVKNAIGVLEDETGSLLAVRADQALEEMEKISDDSNIPVYTRTQVWHIISLLEGNK